MPPKPRSLSVSKQCEECGGPNPVACKTCNGCGADFYSSSLDKSDSPGEPSEVVSDAPSTPGSERRRSERVRREKPDYYDALEFDTKRRGDKVPVGLVTPTRAKRSDKIPYKSPRTPKNLDASGILKRGRPRKWKKGQLVDVKELKEKKKKKKLKEMLKEGQNESKDSVQDPEEEMKTAMDDLPSEKILQCKVSLAEINRKLGVVMCQPF